MSIGSVGSGGGVATRAEVDQLRQMLRDLQSQMARGRDRSAQSETRVETLFSSRRFRRRTVQLPLIPILATPSVTFAWREPLPVDTYLIEPDWPLPTGLSFTLQEMTPAQVILTMSASVLISLNTPMTLTAWC